MLDAAGKALSQMFTPALRGVLLKSAGLALITVIIIGIFLQRVLSALADSGASWAEQTSGVAPHAAWEMLALLLSVMASLGIITGAVFLMPAVTAFVGTFFVDETAQAVEREYYPGEPAGRNLPFARGVLEGVKIAAVSLLVYFCALPFVLLAGLGFLVLFLANAYLLSREYFELAAMRFLSPHEARAMRKANAAHVFLSGMVIAVFVAIPFFNLATPVFAMAFMVHVYKRIAGKRAELIEPAR